MSFATVCDLCHRPYKRIDENEGETVPIALYVEMDGEVVLQYNDLCPSCKAKEHARVKKTLAAIPRNRGGAQEKLAMSDVAVQTHPPEHDAPAAISRKTSVQADSPENENASKMNSRSFIIPPLPEV